ncbi:MAG TPA: phosphatidate cytidylyltransferase [Cytophagales bacterium]|nr:phosphatidate cytidylyltransferase [Cytophagales bacterium]
MALSNLQQRTISGLIGAALMISLIVINAYTFLFLSTALALASLHEFNHLISTKTDARPNKFMAMLISFFAIQISFLVEIGILSNKYYFLSVPLIATIFTAELYRKSAHPFQNIAFTVLSLVFTIIPFLFFLKIAFFAHAQYSWRIVLGLFCILWASDIGAYISGKSFGRHKLFPSVSPGKTWEGALGGALFSIAAAFLIGSYWKDLSLLQWLGTSVIIVVFGMYGDLVESGLKRSIQIKDSGTMIPGHGGFLDRFDGLYLSLPIIYSYLQFFIK